MRIKNISISRNGVEYYSALSFPPDDSLKWILIDNFRKDSILLRDSMLCIELSSKTGVLQFQMDKKYTLIKGDVFRIVLDTIPLHFKTDCVNSFHGRSIPSIPDNKGIKVLYINRHDCFTENKAGIPLFNLAGKRHCKNKLMSTMYIARPDVFIVSDKNLRNSAGKELR